MATAQTRCSALELRAWLTPETIEELALGDHSCGQHAGAANRWHLGRRGVRRLEALARLVVLIEPACAAQVQGRDMICFRWRRSRQPMSRAGVTRLRSCSPGAAVHVRSQTTTATNRSGSRTAYRPCDPDACRLRRAARPRHWRGFCRREGWYAGCCRRRSVDVLAERAVVPRASSPRPMEWSRAAETISSRRRDEGELSSVGTILTVGCALGRYVS